MQPEAQIVYDVNGAGQTLAVLKFGRSILVIFID